MDWKDTLITTSVDRLLKYLARQQEASLSQTAEDLDISRDKIETWIDALEDAGFIEKQYSAKRGTILTANMGKIAQRLEDFDDNSSIEKTGDSQQYAALEKARERLNKLEDAIEKHRQAAQQMEDLLEQIEDEEQELEESSDDDSDSPGAQVLDVLEDVEDDIEAKEKLEDEIEQFEKQKEQLHKDITALTKLEETLQEASQAQQQDDTFPCQFCDRTFDTQRGRSVHETKTHDDESTGFLDTVSNLFS